MPHIKENYQIGGLTDKECVSSSQAFRLGKSQTSNSVCTKVNFHKYKDLQFKNY